MPMARCTVPPASVADRALYGSARYELKKRLSLTLLMELPESTNILMVSFVFIKLKACSGGTSIVWPVWRLLDMREVCPPIMREPVLCIGDIASDNKYC